ncbi:MAG: hypothetical protein J3R72DRAFT_495725 [Linnemannia gamsii]|nr:MAG: hypothetical protein J3R72DRAFT_495725 [Linnemannia gamsii]
MRKKDYDPSILHRMNLATILPRTQHVDVLGSFYRVIRNAYSNHSQVRDHEILDQELLLYGSPIDSILYVEGEQAMEKAKTARTQEIRSKAASCCISSLDTMESLLDNNQRLRWRHFSDVKTNLASSFYWSLQSRKNFVEYTVGRGWKALFCRTEADVAIATDYKAGDVVLSGDSDYFGYMSIERLWRSVSNGPILDYRVPPLLQQLGLTRSQLTGLAVDSKND